MQLFINITKTEVCNSQKDAQKNKLFVAIACLHS